MKKISLILGVLCVILMVNLWFQGKKEASNPLKFETSPSPYATSTPRPTQKPTESIPLSMTFSLNQSEAYPGDCVSIYIANAKNLDDFSVTASFYEKPITFFPYKNGFVGMIPLYAWLEPGGYTLQVEDVIQKTSESISLEVLSKTFDVQYLTVDETTSAINTVDHTSEDQVYFDAARAHPIQEKLWEGPFIQPTQGEISTDYNSTRYTNDDPTPSRHLALDIANAEGTPILASNNGKVVLSRKLIVTGNSIVIDHGMGIFTSSFHMSELIAQEGTYVSQGDIIGKMGSTGYSTGPHLHFAIWKEGTFLNPWSFFEIDPINFSK